MGGGLTVGVADGAEGVERGVGVGAADGELAGADGGAGLVRRVGLALGEGVTTGATLAGDISKDLTNPKNLANSRQVANVK